ncbi:hypothetical protein XENTR_v10023287 [Xenopus tropicalis]|nr:hypothetical protein XENTR_v10023287 [Xenopus tropicalis]
MLQPIPSRAGPQINTKPSAKQTLQIITTAPVVPNLLPLLLQELLLPPATVCCFFIFYVPRYPQMIPPWFQRSMNFHQLLLPPFKAPSFCFHYKFNCCPQSAIHLPLQTAICLQLLPPHLRNALHIKHQDSVDRSYRDSRNTNYNDATQALYPAATSLYLLPPRLDFIPDLHISFKPTGFPRFCFQLPTHQLSQFLQMGTPP